MKKTPSLYDILQKSDNKALTLSTYLTVKTRNKGILQKVNIELSPVCNLNCEICYVRMSEEEVCQSGHHIMRFDEWKYYIDGLKELNINCIAFTGGECMLHPDFMRLYRYTYDLDIEIGLLSNCSCLTDDILDMLTECPPAYISATVYGASKETYERFCKNGAAYDKVMANIDRLVEKGINVIPHITLGKDNVDDYYELDRIFTAKGLRFQFSGPLINYGKCNNETIENHDIDIRQFDKERIEKAVSESGLEIPRKDENYSNYIFPPAYNRIFEKGMHCGATTNSFAVNWKGEMTPCIAFGAYSIDPRKNGGIAESWKKLNEWGKTVPQLVECHNCIFSYECKIGNCIAMHYNDTHEFGKVSPRLCFKLQHPEEAAKLQAEYDRRQALKTAEEKPEKSDRFSQE